jgi:hypothetical protein
MKVIFHVWDYRGTAASKNSACYNFQLSQESQVSAGVSELQVFVYYEWFSRLLCEVVVKVTYYEKLEKKI